MKRMVIHILVQLCQKPTEVSSQASATTLFFSRIGHLREMSLTVVLVQLNEVGHPLDRVLQGMHRHLCLWPTYVLCFFCVSANEASCKPANFNLSKRCLTTLAMMMALKRVRMWYDDDTVEAHQGGTSTTPLRVTAAAANLLMAAHDEDVVDKVIILNHDETYQRSWKSVYVIVIIILLIIADVLSNLD